MRTSSAAALVLVFLAAAGYFFELGHPSLWFDEAYSAAFAALPWEKLREVMIAADGEMAAYYAFLHVWTALGNNEFLLRVPSVLAGLVALGATFILGRRLFDSSTALIATAMLAANPLFISLAREARSYSFAIAFVTLAAIVFLSANAENRRRDWIAYAALCIAAAYSHLFSALVVLAHAAYAAATPGRVRLRPFSLAAGAIGLGVVPIVCLVAGGDLTHLDWIPRTTPASVAGLALSFSGSAPLAAVECVLLVAAAFVSRRSSNDGDRFAWCWLLVPAIVVIVLSFGHPMLVPRYLSIVLPAFCLLLARGLTAIPLLPVKVFMAAIVVALSAASPRTDVPFEDWRGAVDGVLERAQPHDALIAYPPDVAVPVTYYLQRHVGARLSLLFPKGTPLTEGIPPLSFINFGEVSSTHERLWLLLRQDEIGESVRRAVGQIGGSYELRQSERFRGVTVLLWSARR